MQGWGWIKVRWGGSCMGGVWSWWGEVGHVGGGVGWVMLGWGASCRGGVGHAGMGWVM